MGEKLGRLPAPQPSSTPAPTIVADPDDLALATEAHFWIKNTKPRGLTKDMADAVKTWLSKKGL